LAENTNPDFVESEIKKFKAKQQGKALDEVVQKAHLQKITDIHLHSDKLREIEANSNIYIIYVFIIAGIILLLISFSNYANLILGMSVFYSKFQIINKILGSSNRVNLKYFITEGLLISLSTVIMSILIIIPFNIIIKQYYGMELLSGNTELMMLLFILFIILILITGILPVIKQTFSSVRLNSSSDIALLSSRKKKPGVLMILQYTFSIVLIIAVIAIARQTNFLLNNSLGNQSDNTIYIESAQGKFQIFREELLKHNSIVSVSAMFTKFGGESNDMFPFKLEGYRVEKKNNRNERIGVFPCDYSFPSFFNLQFLSGNDFSDKIEDNEGSGEYIISVCP
jgi:putative ABC transport system permease protein